MKVDAVTNKTPTIRLLIAILYDFVNWVLDGMDPSSIKVLSLFPDRSAASRIILMHLIDTDDMNLSNSSLCQIL